MNDVIFEVTPVSLLVICICGCIILYLYSQLNTHRNSLALELEKLREGDKERNDLIRLVELAPQSDRTELIQKYLHEYLMQKENNRHIENIDEFIGDDSLFIMDRDEFIFQYRDKLDKNIISEA